MALHKISLTVNGSTELVEVPSNMTLLQMLRERLVLTGVKNGCAAGECGACTVILDGEPVNACLVLAGQADGRRVETIEGLSRSGRLHPLQAAFVEDGAVQCGFCTPGAIMAAKALARYEPKELRPGAGAESDAELRRAAGDLGTTIFHPVGTCKMGRDDLAVVDERLRVHGVLGLRVVDASIMPRITSGNTNAPTVMIAEKAAEMVRADRLAGALAQRRAVPGHEAQAAA